MEPLPQERPSFDSADPFIHPLQVQTPSSRPGKDRPHKQSKKDGYPKGAGGFFFEFLRKLLDPLVLAFFLVLLVTSNVGTYLYTTSILPPCAEPPPRVAPKPMEIYASALENSRFFIEPYQMKGPIAWSCLNPKVQDEFTLDGKIPVLEDMKDDQQEKRGWRVDAKQMKSLVAAAKSHNANASLCMYGTYCNRVWFQALDEHPVKGLRVMIIGTQWPWLEAMCIAYGAKTVTTVDHNKPMFEHKKISTISTLDVEDIEGTFDAILTYSSIEHDGLGRYSDIIDPDGDLQRMKKIKGLLKPGGKLYLGVPNGQDFLVFNLHRVYGPLRFPLLIEGWRRLSTYGVTEDEMYMPKFGAYIQPVHVLTAVTDSKGRVIEVPREDKL